MPKKPEPKPESEQSQLEIRMNEYTLTDTSQTSSLEEKKLEHSSSPKVQKFFLFLYRFPQIFFI